jgi:hypothetical protein
MITQTVINPIVSDFFNLLQFVERINDPQGRAVRATRTDSLTRPYRLKSGVLQRIETECHAF